ncbi:hydroxymethylbilane synthase [Galbibacter sp. EGI 63066]|uniref:hydroxymethylbilane synthase n=1 Tax=Galbibacter sp. EGI 63066 TaxID=2993559 RepID=UPI0022495723|nr:hydroxymethylbilane synthase [Galbibacter sp. EGI 63066]MCX2681258.1 hydroxymethylbilane synthase [Galbibacter sp. EGI 63066]
MNKVIRIGTRDSELALWQANHVKDLLGSNGYRTEIVSVKSDGDLILDKPLYELGITGIFTKTLDIAMLNGTVDIAVHSMKDVPTQLPKGIVKAAVLKRANTQDILVFKGDVKSLEGENTIIATGSLRRKAQWLHKYPKHKVEGLRGNVNTRLKKLNNSNWNGAVFAAAGLERLDFIKKGNKIKSPSFGGVGEDLDWMIPAPAQGAMMVVAMENDTFSREALEKLNHNETDICTHIEREFLSTLEGGCTAPIGALAKRHKNMLTFEGALFSLDGKEKIAIKKSVALEEFKNFGKICAEEVLQNGGRALMQQIKNTLQS